MIDIPFESQITTDTVIKFIKDNSDKLKIIELLWLLKQPKYNHLADDILNLSFSTFANNLIQIHEHDECKKEIIKLYGKIINLSITEIQKKLGNCDRLVLAKTIKFLEQKNNTGFRIKPIGKRKGRKYTLLKDEEYKEDESVIDSNDDDIDYY